MGRIILTLAFLTFSYSALSAEEAPTLKLVGTWKVGLGQNAFVEDRLNVWNLNVGDTKLEFFGMGSGKAINPCGEWGEQRDSGTIAMNVHCSVLMDDGSVILYEYRGRLRLDESGGDLWGNGDPMTAGEGMAYWIGVPVLKTKSEKYAWVNEAVFVMRGNILVPPGKSDDPHVQYDIYQIEYNF
ncbi:DUF3237 domain-containing protein [Burkholderiales bacterium]|nr:DUF3237 domain-containing protein [Burkholderiales bacterium]